jgi:multimeric flavodoxin WrbA
MRITILNGDPDPASPFQAYVQDLAQALEASGHEVMPLALRRLTLKGCSGCFGCWVKTPGECVKQDDSAVVCRAALEADLVVLASPMVMGFTTELLKRAVDQMIPLLQPFFEIEGGETHHRARYRAYPKFAVLLGRGAGTDAEDLELTFTMWKRLARNLKSRVVATAVADRPVQEVAHGLTAAA